MRTKKKEEKPKYEQTALSSRRDGKEFQKGVSLVRLVGNFGGGLPKKTSVTTQEKRETKKTPTLKKGIGVP